MAEKPKTKSSKKQTGVKLSEHGRVYVSATFNNTLVTITNDKGDAISASSSGAAGFKGTRRSTPFAATSAVESAAKKAVDKGLKTVDVYIKGPGAGRRRKSSSNKIRRFIYIAYCGYNANSTQRTKSKEKKESISKACELSSKAKLVFRKQN